MALVFPACGGSEAREAKEPRQPARDERLDAARLLAQAIEAQEAGNSKLADERYARAIELEPSHYETAERYTRFLIEEGRAERAVKVASGFLSNALGETKGYHLLADAQIAAEDWIGAHGTLTELIELDEGDGAAYEKRGRVQAMRSNFNDAVEDLKKAIELEPENADFRASLGSALERADRLNEAALELRSAIQLEPRHGRAHVLLGIVLRKQGEFSDAVKVHEQAVKFAPESARAYFELGVSQNYVGNNPGAEVSLKKATELDPADALNWYAYGEVLRTMKRYKEAVEPYRTALELDPNHAKAANKLGIVLFHAGLLDEAEVVLTARVREHPEDPYTYFNLGQVYAEQQKYGLAVNALEKFIELAPKGDGDIAVARKQIRTLKRKIPAVRSR